MALFHRNKLSQGKNPVFGKVLAKNKKKPSSSFDKLNLNVANMKAKVNHGKKDSFYEKELNEGISLFEKFQKDGQESTIKQSAGKFFSAIFAKRTQMIPYLFLSMIFYVFDENETAKEYFETAVEFESQTDSDFIDIRENTRRLLYSF